MKLSSKPLSLIICLTFSILSLNAQPLDREYAPNALLTDLNNQTHNLHNYLNQGKSVVLFFFDAQNPPSWSYHASQSLQQLQSQHGDSAVVLYVEGNLQTSQADLTNSALGNWLSNNPCPVINLATDTFLLRYGIQDFPVVMTICPERVAELSGQRTAQQHLELIGDCKGLAKDSVDTRILKFYGPTHTCNQFWHNVRYTVQNNGLKTIKKGRANVYYQVGQTFWTELIWEGELEPYEITEIVLPLIYIGFDEPGWQTIRFYPMDPVEDPAQTGDNYTSLDLNWLYLPIYDSTLTLEVVTDQFGAETTWELRSFNGQLVANGGPYEQLSSPGTTYHSHPLTVSNVMCYNLVVRDLYGDGMCCDYGNGSFKLTDASGKVVGEGSSDYLEARVNFSTGGFLPVYAPDMPGTTLTLYPNPAKDQLNLDFLSGFESNMSFEIWDMQGNFVSEGILADIHNQIDVSQLQSGLYLIKCQHADYSYTQKFVKE